MPAAVATRQRPRSTRRTRPARWSGGSSAASADRRSSQPSAGNDSAGNAGLLLDEGGHKTAGARPHRSGVGRHGASTSSGSEPMTPYRTAPRQPEPLDYRRPAMRRSFLVVVVVLAGAAPVLSTGRSAAAPGPALFVVADSV